MNILDFYKLKRDPLIQPSQKSQQPLGYVFILYVFLKVRKIKLKNKNHFGSSDKLQPMYLSN